MWVKSLPPICQNERQRPLLRMFVEGAASRPWVVRALHDVTGEHRRKPIKNPQRVKRDFHILHVTPPKCQHSQAPPLQAPRDCRYNATQNWSLTLQSFDFVSNNNVFGFSCFPLVFSLKSSSESGLRRHLISYCASGPSARLRPYPYLLNMHYVLVQIQNERSPSNATCRTKSQNLAMNQLANRIWQRTLFAWRNRLKERARWIDG